MTDDLARTDAPELLPCPFCGGEAHIDGTSWTTRDGKDQAWATCRKCGTYGPSSTDAVAAWNRRAPTALAASPEVQALLREARVQVIEEVTKLPNRIEPIGGQNHRYVRIEEILLLDPATIVAQVDAGQATGAWRDIATAPERIWVDIDENPRGALIGTVFATDLGDVPYILATPTAIAASPEMQALLAAETARADAAEALVKGLRDFVVDFADAKIDALRYSPPHGASPEDEPDPVVDAETVWAWQADAKDAIKAAALAQQPPTPGAGDDQGSE